MKYIVSAYDVFNALGNVRAGVSVGDYCCSHSCNGHECSGHTDIQNYVVKPPDERADTTFENA